MADKRRSVNVNLGRALCEIFDLDASTVREITLRCEVDRPTVLVVEHFISDDEAEQIANRARGWARNGR